MATMGLKYMAWAKMLEEPKNAVPTYNPGLVLGKSVSTNMTITNAEGELYADDMLAEYASEFSSAQLTAEVDNIELPNQAKIYGATFDDENGLQFNASDNAPYGGIGGYQVVSVNNERRYRAWFFPKAKAAIPDWTGATKGSSISFGTQPMNLKIMAPNYGPWYYVKEFTTEAAAQAFIDEKLNVANWLTASIQVQNATGTKGAMPNGTVYVAEGGTLEIEISGTPTVLYDNGVDRTASISDGKYTLAAMTQNHTIAIIF